MTFEFELPDVGEGVAEGEIVAWHVEPGDTVTEDQVLAEVETDKAVVDLPSPVEGTVLELHAEVGDVVPVGDVVITIDVEGEGDGASGDVETDEVVADTDADKSADDETTADDATVAGADGETSDAPAAASSERVFAPPNVRRLARELGVDVTAVDGSGPGGRVTEGDIREAAGAGGADDETVESAVSRVDDGATSDDDRSGEGQKPAVKSATKRVGEQGSETAAKADQTGKTSVESADRDRTLATPATRKLAREEGIDLDSVPTEKTRDGEAFVEPEDVRAYVDGQARADAEAAGDTASTAEPTASMAGEATTTAASEGTPATGSRETTREPYSGIRRTIGQQMERSKYTAPHVTHHDTAVVPDLVELRETLKPRASERDVKLTYLPFVLKAIVAGLKEYPVLNTTLDEENEEVVYRHYYDMGIAVATDAGLLVPVIENVDEKGLLEIAAETNELAARARERDLAPDEMRGSTFTVTNFGAIGGEYATPIINYPETAILGLGSLQERPTVEDGEVVARHTLPLSLSIDHRVIDGAEAAQFVNTVKEYLEDPTLLLLE